MLNVCITNLGKYNEGELIYERLYLPFLEGELEEVLEKIGINEEYEEWFISDYETELNISIGEYQNITDLNYCIEELESMDIDINIINGILDHYTTDLEEVVQILRNGNYTVLYNVKSESDIGMAIAEELYDIDLTSYISNFINYSDLASDTSYNLIGGNMALEVY